MFTLEAGSPLKGLATFLYLLSIVMFAIISFSKDIEGKKGFFPIAIFVFGLSIVLTPPYRGILGGTIVLMRAIIVSIGVFIAIKYTRFCDNCGKGTFLSWKFINECSRCGEPIEIEEFDETLPESKNINKLKKIFLKRDTPFQIIKTKKKGWRYF